MPDLKDVLESTSEEVAEKPKTTPEDTENQNIDTSKSNPERKSEEEPSSDQKTEDKKPETTLFDEQKKPESEKKEEKTNVIESLTDGKYKSERELFEAFKESQAKAKEYEEYKEKAIVPTSYAQKVFDLESKGIKVTPRLLQDLEINWGEMDPNNREDALKMVETSLKLKYPDLDDDLIQHKINKSYRYDEDSRREELSDKYPGNEDKVESIIKREKEEIQKDLAIEARTSLSTLKEYQESLTKVEDGGKQKGDNTEFLNDLSESLKGFESLSVKYGDEDVSVPMSEDNKRELAMTAELFAKGSPEFWKRIGGINGFLEAIALKEHKSALIEEVSKRAGESAKKKEVDNLTNQNPHNRSSEDDLDIENEDDKNFARQMGALV